MPVPPSQEPGEVVGDVASAIIDVDSSPEPVNPKPFVAFRTSPLALRCSAYHLKTPDGDPPLMHYPVALESKRQLPWKLELHDDKIFLRSTHCTGFSASLSTPCTFCRALALNDVVSGISHRMEHGASEKTNRFWLSYVHLCDELTRKNTQIDLGRREALNTARKLLSRTRNLDGWKRLVHAISHSNSPRIQVTIGVALKAGCGFLGAIEMVDKAARHVYRPQSYDEADYHRAFLIWKLGGAAAARIAHRAFGTPSLDTISRHVMTSHIRGSALFPLVEELQHNLAITFEGVPEPDIIIGVSILADEIKTQGRLRWNAETNQIIGLCREHSSDCVVEFLTMAQANFVLSQLQATKVHLASEVRDFSA